MSLIWGRASSSPRRARLVLLTIGACLVLYVCGRITSLQTVPMLQRSMGVMHKDADETSVGWDPVSLWRQSSLLDLSPGRRQQHVYYQRSEVGYDRSAEATRAAGENNSRKIVRTAELQLEVKDPSNSLEQIRALAERVNGYLVSSQVAGGLDSPFAAITIRVPTSRFEESLAEIKKLAEHLESEKVQAEDVTRNYVDREANLRNLRAQEAQYLLIMKRASTVSDTLEVSSKLSEVRGQLEQQQAEFLALARQIETVAISVSLIPTSETHVFWFHWRPWYTVKLAVRDGLDGLAHFAGAATTIIFLLPTICLWLAMITLGAALAIRILRWVWRTFFTFTKSKPAEPQPVPTQ